MQSCSTDSLGSQPLSGQPSTSHTNGYSAPVNRSEEVIDQLPSWLPVIPVVPPRPVSGGVVSIVKRSTTGVGSVCPPTVARAAKSWLDPGAEAVQDSRAAHAARAAPSREHSKVPPGGTDSSTKLALWRGPLSTPLP